MPGPVDHRLIRLGEEINSGFRTSSDSENQLAEILNTKIDVVYDTLLGIAKYFDTVKQSAARKLELEAKLLENPEPSKLHTKLKNQLNGLNTNSQLLRKPDSKIDLMLCEHQPLLRESAALISEIFIKIYNMKISKNEFFMRKLGFDEIYAKVCSDALAGITPTHSSWTPTKIT